MSYGPDKTVCLPREDYDKAMRLLAGSVGVDELKEAVKLLTVKPRPDYGHLEGQDWQGSVGTGL